MLIRFGFSNFRSIKEFVDLSLEASSSNELEEYYILQPIDKLRLLKVAAIYGANASGKSNVLQALDFLRRLVLEPLGKKTDSINYDRFAFDEDYAAGNTEFRIDFCHKGIRYGYQIVINPEFVVSESLQYYNPNKALVFSRSTDPEKELTDITFGSKIKLSAEERKSLTANTLWNNTVLGGFLKTNTDFPELAAATDWFDTYLNRLIIPGTNLVDYISSQIETGGIDKERLIQILGKADFHISDIHIEDNRLQLLEYLNKSVSTNINLDQRSYETGFATRFIPKKKVSLEHQIEDSDGKSRKAALSFEDESLGTQRFYQFAGLIELMTQKGQVFFIDELESSLHPDLIKHLLLSFLVNTKNSQMIFTSHYRELMAEGQIMRNDIFHFTEKLPDGSTDLFALSDFSTNTIRKTSSVYNAYKIGKLGATPQLQDPSIEYGNE